MQLGFVGLGKMGLNMVHAPRRAAAIRSSPTTAAPRRSPAAESAGARGVASLDALVARGSRRRAPCG